MVTMMAAEETPLLAPHRITRSDDHVYYYEGQAYPGVTTVLDILDKSGPLMAWAAKQTAQAAVTMADPKTNGLGNQTPLDLLLEAVGPDGAIKALTARSGWKRDEAAHIGSAVHGYADEMHRDPAVVERVPKHIVDHVQHYAKWWYLSGWQLRASEAMVVHPEHGYGGTLDLLAYDADHRTVLADIKTGNNVYPTAILQLAAYAGATLIQMGGTVYEMPAIDRYVILHVTKEGTREIEVNIGTLEQLAWGACLDLHAWYRTVKGKRL